MRGIDSVAKGYAAGGSVNPFTAYAGGGVNPFAALAALPFRPEYTPSQVSTPPASTPGYMSIYGNLPAVVAEQARRRALASEPDTAPIIPTPGTNESVSQGIHTLGDFVPAPTTQTTPGEGIVTTSSPPNPIADALGRYGGELPGADIANPTATMLANALDTFGGEVPGLNATPMTQPSGGSTLGDLAKAALSVGSFGPTSIFDILGGIAASHYKDPAGPVQTLSQMAGLSGYSPGALAEMKARGEDAGIAAAQAIQRGYLTPDLAATILTNNPNLVGSVSPALTAMENYLKSETPQAEYLTPEVLGNLIDSLTNNTITRDESKAAVDAAFGNTAGLADTPSGSDASGGGGFSAGDGQQDPGGGWAEGGHIPGDSGGMDDDVPAVIDGKRPARLSSGEFVFDAATVAALGDGNNAAGARKLNELRKAIRTKAYGHPKQPPKNFSVGDLIRAYDRK